MKRKQTATTHLWSDLNRHNNHSISGEEFNHNNKINNAERDEAYSQIQSLSKQRKDRALN